MVKAGIITAQGYIFSLKGALRTGQYKQCWMLPELQTQFSLLRGSLKKGCIINQDFQSVNDAEKQCRYITVNGYSDLDQLLADRSALTLEELGLELDYTEEELMELAQKTRVMAEDELWILVDAVFPEEE